MHDPTDPHNFTHPQSSWERCPVCTNHCVANECAAGCAIVVPYPGDEPLAEVYVSRPMEKLMAAVTTMFKGIYK